MIQSLGKLIIVLGVLMTVIGIFLYVGGKIGLGRLPGDLVYRRGGLTVYFPLVSGLILSLVLTVVLNLVLRIRR